MNYFKKVFLMIFLLLVIGGGRSWATTITITFPSGNTLNTGDTVDGWQLLTGYSITGGTMRLGKMTNHIGWSISSNSELQVSNQDAALALLDMRNGDKITVEWTSTEKKVEAHVANQLFSVSGSTRSYLGQWGEVVSGSDYYMSSDGTLELWLHKSNADKISKITIVREDNPGITIKKSSNETNLIDMNFEESQAIAISPANANVTYTVSNEKIAVMKDAYSGDVMFKRTGIVAITATMTLGGQTYTGTYNVTVKAEDATFALTNNRKTFTLTGAGVLTARVETSVPNITVEFGTTDNSLYNTTIVRYINSEYVATTIDYNGWQHIWPTENNKGLETVPYQGTFYTFKPSASGSLTISGFRTGGNTAVLVDATDNFTKKLEFNTSDASGLITKTVSITNGHTYYLYGNTANTNGGDWTNFQLHSYTFEPIFALSKTADIYARVGLSAPTDISNALTITGAHGDETCTVLCEGNISSATATVVNGQLNISNIAYSVANDDDDHKGGAIIVDISGSNGSGMFVYTIPYKKKVWQFATISESEARINFNHLTDKSTNWTNDDWCLTYEVRNYTDRVLTEIKDPIKAAVSPINGNNAYYVAETAGLWFETPSQSFGCRITDWSVDQSSLTKDEQRDQPVTNGIAVDYVGFSGVGSIIKIPQLLANTYVRVWWEPHAAGSSGAHFRAENLTDLDGKLVSEQFCVTGTSWNNSRSSFYGNTIFKVHNSGDVKLILDDHGWNKIVKIEISDSGNFDSDLFVYSNDTQRTLNQITNNNATFSHEENSTIAQIVFSGSNTHSEKARYPIYTCTGEGSVSFTQGVKSWTSAGGVHYEDLKLTNISGRGHILIRQDIKDMSGKYVFDRCEAWIAIGSYKQQVYPYTWDFNSYNMDRPAQADRSTTKMAATVDNNKYGEWQTNGYLKEYSTQVSALTGKTIEKYLFANGSELCTSTVSNDEITILAIPETKGLKIGMPHIISTDRAERANNNIKLDGTLLAITQPSNVDSKTSITIPQVGSGYYVFIKGSNYSKNFTVEGATEVTSTFNLAADVKAYQVTASAATDVVISAYYMNIQKIAVTDQTKTINLLGYATESRAHSIDHTYTGEFTTDDVNAYAIQYGSYDRTKATVTKSAQVQVVPAQTGVVLYKANATAACIVPLFHPAVNNELESGAVQMTADESALTGNMMAPCVTGKLFDSETEGDKTVFIMARTFYTYQKGVGNSEAQTSNVEAFYRMKLGASEADNTMTANKAYLLVPTAQLPTSAWDEDAAGGGSARGYLFFAEDLMQLGDATAISRITTDGDNTAEGNGEATAPRADVWYTLSGQRLQVKPTQSGIYIVNGKKCYIK